MIGKILHGSAFGGLVKYVNDPRKMATLVAASDGVNLSNSQAITDSFDNLLKTCITNLWMRKYECHKTIMIML